VDAAEGSTPSRLTVQSTAAKAGRAARFGAGPLVARRAALEVLFRATTSERTAQLVPASPASLVDPIHPGDGGGGGRGVRHKLRSNLQRRRRSPRSRRGIRMLVGRQTLLASAPSDDAPAGNRRWSCVRCGGWRGVRQMQAASLLGRRSVELSAVEPLQRLLALRIGRKGEDPPRGPPPALRARCRAERPERLVARGRGTRRVHGSGRASNKGRQTAR